MSAKNTARRRGTTTTQSATLSRLRPHLAPPKGAERQHARPGAGIKCSRNAMAKTARTGG